MQEGVFTPIPKDAELGQTEEVYSVSLSLLACLMRDAASPVKRCRLSAAAPRVTILDRTTSSARGLRLARSSPWDVYRSIA